jgi:hypothetical protein
MVSASRRTLTWLVDIVFFVLARLHRKTKKIVVHIVNDVSRIAG